VQDSGSREQGWGACFRVQGAGPGATSSWLSQPYHPQMPQLHDAPRGRKMRATDSPARKGIITSEDPRPHGLCMLLTYCLSCIFPKGHMALHPPYNRVKAVGAIASHQLWTIGVVALPHTSHAPLCYPQFATRQTLGANSGGAFLLLLPHFATLLTRGEHSYFFSPISPLC